MFGDRREQFQSLRKQKYKKDQSNRINKNVYYKTTNGIVLNIY